MEQCISGQKPSKNPTLIFNEQRMNAAVQLTHAWAMCRNNKANSPTVNQMFDAFESFHEQLVLTEANGRVSLIISPRVLVSFRVGITAINSWLKSDHSIGTAIRGRLIRLTSVSINGEKYDLPSAPAPEGNGEVPVEDEQEPQPEAPAARQPRAAQPQPAQRQQPAPAPQPRAQPAARTPVPAQRPAFAARQAPARTPQRAYGCS